MDNHPQQYLTSNSAYVIPFPAKNSAEQLIDQWLVIETMPNGMDKLVQASIWRGDVKR